MYRAKKNLGGALSVRAYTSLEWHFLWRMGVIGLPSAVGPRNLNAFRLSWEQEGQYALVRLLKATSVGDPVRRISCEAYRYFQVVDPERFA